MTDSYSERIREGWLAVGEDDRIVAQEKGRMELRKALRDRGLDPEDYEIVAKPRGLPCLM